MEPHVAKTSVIFLIFWVVYKVYKRKKKKIVTGKERRGRYLFH